MHVTLKNLKYFHTVEMLPPTRSYKLTKIIYEAISFAFAFLFSTFFKSTPESAANGFFQASISQICSGEHAQGTSIVADPL